HTGFKPRQLFGLMGEKRRDDLDSLAGLIPRARPIYRARNNYLIHTRAGEGFRWRKKTGIFVLWFSSAFSLFSICLPTKSPRRFAATPFGKGGEGRERDPFGKEGKGRERGPPFPDFATLNPGDILLPLTQSPVHPAGVRRRRRWT